MSEVKIGEILFHIFGYHYPLFDIYYGDVEVPESVCKVCFSRIYYSFDYGWLTDGQMGD